MSPPPRKYTLKKPSLFKLGLSNVVNEMAPFLKILNTNFFLNAFSFINICFQIFNVKIASVSGVIYIKFVNKDSIINK